MGRSGEYVSVARDPERGGKRRTGESRATSRLLSLLRLVE